MRMTADSSFRAERQRGRWEAAARFRKSTRRTTAFPPWQAVLTLLYRGSSPGHSASSTQLTLSALMPELVPLNTKNARSDKMSNKSAANWGGTRAGDREQRWLDNVF